MFLRRRPRLIHPVPVVLEILDRSQSFFDTSAREAVRQAVHRGSQPNTGSRTTVKGHVMFYFAGGRIDYPTPDRRGSIEGTDGYVVFRIKDLIAVELAAMDADGVVTFGLKRGDRIVQLGSRRVDLYVLNFEDFAHYPGMNQTMIQVNFQDRTPSAQKGNL